MSGRLTRIERVRMAIFDPHWVYLDDRCVIHSIVNLPDLMGLELIIVGPVGHWYGQPDEKAPQP